MDDGQISLANIGGGIGPHVDDYDVFLIQMSGRREWSVGRRFISVKEEAERLVEGLDVRVLKDTIDNDSSGEVTTVVLEPGDVLYLPPRVGHCGTALTDGCMTLSVGMKSPSSKELISTFKEHRLLCR